MDDAFLVRVLDTVAHLEKQIEALFRRQPMTIAVRGDRLATHVLHGKKRTALRRDARVQDLRDRRMRHQRERLAFRFESRHDLRGIHPGFDDFQRDLTMNGSRLFGEPHVAHAAFSHSLEKAIWADGVESVCRRRRLRDVVVHGADDITAADFQWSQISASLS